MGFERRASAEGGRRVLRQSSRVTAFLWTSLRAVLALATCFAPALAAAQYTTIYRANLHIHTQISNKPQAEDHTGAEWPAETMQNAVSRGLDVVGFSDHGMKVLPSDWNLLKTVADNYAASSTGIALRGFEWTYGELLTLNDTAHINVFGTASFTDVKALGGQPPVLTPDLADLSEWLKDASMAEGYGGKPVGQFNHIYQGDHFWDFTQPALFTWMDEIMCLAELDTLYLETFTGPEDSEGYWRTALKVGWHVAPTIGIDNYYALDDRARKNHTGIWVEPGAGRLQVMDALRARRIFASEDANFQLQFRAQPEGATGSYRWMGSKIAVGNSQGLKLAINAFDPDGDPFENLALVQVVNAADNEKVVDIRDVGLPSLAKYVDLEPSQLQSLTPTDLGEICLYVRVKQDDGVSGDWIYSAPIWVSIGDPSLEAYNATAPLGEPVRLKARFKQGANAGIPDKPVYFYVDGTFVGQGHTDSSGNVSVAWVVPESFSLGAHTIHARFFGDSEWSAQTGTATLTAISSSATTVQVASVAGEIGQAVVLRADLKRTCDGDGVGGRALAFYVENQFVANASTDGNGRATVAYTIPSALGNGLRSIKVSFAGDARYGASTGYGNLRVGHIVFVATWGNDGYDGGTWQTAKRTVQAGVTTAGGLAEVWVAEGTYEEKVVSSTDVKLYGGFAGTEGRKDERVPGANPTWIAPGTVYRGLSCHGNSIIEGIGFKNCSEGISSSNHLNVTSCAFYDVDYPLFIDAASVQLNAMVNGCSFSGYSTQAVYFRSNSPVPAHSLALLNNEFSGKTALYVWAYDGSTRFSELRLEGNRSPGSRAVFSFSRSVALDGDTSWLKQEGLSWEFGYGSLVVGETGSLHLGPGCVLRFANNSYSSGIYASGTLSSGGTSSDPVVFTSAYDGSPFGEADNAGTSDWVGLNVGGTNSTLSHVDVRHAATGLFVNTTVPFSIVGSSFARNAFGVRNNGTSDTDARGCWWGDASGPYHATLNPGGQGDPVSDRVLFDPWIGKAEVAGVITLQDFSGDITLVPVLVEVRNPGTTTVVQSQTVYPAADGSFTFTTTLSGTHDVVAKASHWLRAKVVNVVFGDTGASNLSFSLVNGDCTGDNTVNLSDLTAVSRAWRTHPGDALWNANADLNGDNTVNLTDRNIVSRNWRKSGAP